jgi:hypothetical protein
MGTDLYWVRAASREDGITNVPTAAVDESELYPLLAEAMGIIAEADRHTLCEALRDPQHQEAHVHQLSCWLQPDSTERGALLTRMSARGERVWEDSRLVNDTGIEPFNLWWAQHLLSEALPQRFPAPVCTAIGLSIDTLQEDNWMPELGEQSLASVGPWAVRLLADSRLGEHPLGREMGELWSDLPRAHHFLLAIRVHGSSVKTPVKYSNPDEEPWVTLETFDWSSGLPSKHRRVECTFFLPTRWVGPIGAGELWPSRAYPD